MKTAIGEKEIKDIFSLMWLSNQILQAIIYFYLVHILNILITYLCHVL